MPKPEIWLSSLIPSWVEGWPTAHDIPPGKGQSMWKIRDAIFYPHFVDVAIRLSVFFKMFSRDVYLHMKDHSQITLVLKFNIEFIKF